MSFPMKQISSLPLSIIIPVYNVERYLERCVQSILTQSYTDYEVILVDDGSTDRSGVLCDELALRDSRIRVFHQVNGGQGGARNTGLKYALGKYIWFIDSDDYISENSLACIIEQIERTQVELLLFSLIRVTDNDFIGSPLAPSLLRVSTGEEILRHQLGSISPCSFVSLKSLWEGLEYIPHLYFEDFEIWPRLMQKVTKADALRFPIVPYCYYVREGSTMHQPSVQKRREQLEHFFRIEELWSQWFHFEDRTHTAYELLMMKQGTNLLHRNVLNFVRDSPFPPAMKLRIYGMLWKRGAFSWFYKGKLRQPYPGRLSIRLFWNTIGRSLLLFSLFSMVEDLMKKVRKS